MHSISVDATTMVSNVCSIIDEHTIVTVRLTKNILNFSFKRVQLKNEFGDPQFHCCNKHNKMQLNMQTNLWRGFTATSIFGKLKGARPRYFI